MYQLRVVLRGVSPLTTQLREKVYTRVTWPGPLRTAALFAWVAFGAAL